MPIARQSAHLGNSVQTLPPSGEACVGFWFVFHQNPVYQTFANMPLTVPQKIRLVELAIQTGSATTARRRFMREGNRRSGPSVKLIRRLLAQFRVTGALAGSKRKRACPVSARAVVKIKKAIAKNPHHSTRQLAEIAEVSQSVVEKILKKWLGLYPYKLQRVQKQRRGDKAKRIRLCKWLVPKLNRPQFHRNLFTSDECHFFLNGAVLKQNCRVWGLSPPSETIPYDPYAPHITVWCALSSTTVVGPYFFEDGGATVTVTGARYREMLEQFFVPELQRLNLPLNRIWFQQDGAPAHTAAHVLGYLAEVFPGHVISKNAAVVWPPRSPDLAPPDFFLWGWLKNQCYAKPVSTLRELKWRIRRHLRAVPPSMLHAVGDSMLARCRACVANKGGTFEH